MGCAVGKLPAPLRYSSAFRRAVFAALVVPSGFDILKVIVQELATTSGVAVRVQGLVRVRS